MWYHSLRKGKQGGKGIGGEGRLGDSSFRL
jgi:hypothetical protein